MPVGMPHTIYLNDFGDFIYAAFGQVGYHVGSSLLQKSGWRDVDVRVLIDDDEYRELYGDPENPHANPAWVAMALAWSAFGKSFTDLPIDFQIQPVEWANGKFKDCSRGALISQRRGKYSDGSDVNPSKRALFLDAHQRLLRKSKADA